MKEITKISEADQFINKKEIKLAEVSILELDVLLANSQNAIPFKEYVLDLINKGTKNIIIDLRSAYVVDSTFIGAMVVILKKIKAVNGKMRIVLASELNPINSFFITGLNKVFNIYNNLDEAKQSLID